ncbi:MAG: hypothetical protein ACRD1C_11970 [Terriglobales bacterium]
MFRRIPDLLVSGLLLLTAAAAQQAAAGASSPPPSLQFGASAATAYDSNIRQNDQQIVAGWEQDLDGWLQFDRQSSLGGWSLRYQPSLQVFAAQPGWNSLNQTADFQASQQLAEHWTLSGAAHGGDWEQMPEAQLLGQQAGPEPNALLPRTRETTGSGQMQLTYTLTPRTSLAVYGGYSERRFPGAGSFANTLSGVHGYLAGARYQLVATQRTQWGLQWEAQNYGIGTSSHLAAQSIVGSWTRAWTPLTTTTVSAGPEYSEVHASYTMVLSAGGLPISLTDRVQRVRVDPRVTAKVANANRALPWTLAFSRQVSNGGGALPFPVSLLDVSASVAPRLPGRWRLRLGLHCAQFSALTDSQLAGRVRMAAARGTFEHPLGSQMSLQLDYALLLQRSQGALPLTAAVTRNWAGVRLAWQWPPRGLGDNN